MVSVSAAAISQFWGHQYRSRPCSFVRVIDLSISLAQEGQGNPRIR